MTYHILTEPNPPTRRQILTRSCIRTRQKNIGLQTEHVNQNPAAEQFVHSLSEILQSPIGSTNEVPLLETGEKIADTFATQGTEFDITVLEDNPSDADDIYPLDPDETLPLDLDAINDPESHNNIISSESALDDSLEFRKILEHL